MESTLKVLNLDVSDGVSHNKGLTLSVSGGGIFSCFFPLPLAVILGCIGDSISITFGKAWLQLVCV